MLTHPRHYCSCNQKHTRQNYFLCVLYESPTTRTNIIDSDAPSYTTSTPIPNFLDQVLHASCCLILTATYRVFDPNPSLTLSRRVSFVIDTDTHNTQSYHTISNHIISSPPLSFVSNPPHALPAGSGLRIIMNHTSLTGSCR